MARLEEAERLGAVAFDARRRAEETKALEEARELERRLEDIHAELARLVERASGERSRARIRTLSNQVAVLRKDLVERRGVEDPFLVTETHA